jgi:hypothetical protein
MEDETAADDDFLKFGRLGGDIVLDNLFFTKAISISSLRKAGFAWSS